MNENYYVELLSTQLRKGFLAYCVLKVLSHGEVYTSDILKRLHSANLVVVEGTIYPLLSRLHKDGLLLYEWQESEQGPPRKYYRLSEYGERITERLGESIDELNKTMKKL